MTVPIKRTQLMLARKLWARPNPSTATTVESQAKVAFEEGLLTRDEKEVLEILIDALRRGWS